MPLHPFFFSPPPPCILTRASHTSHGHKSAIQVISQCSGCQCSGCPDSLPAARLLSRLTAVPLLAVPHRSSLCLGEALQQSQLLPRLLGCTSSNHDQKHNRGFSLFPSSDFMALILPLCCGELLHRRTVCLHFYTSDLPRQCCRCCCCCCCCGTDGSAVASSFAALQHI